MSAANLDPHLLATLDPEERAAFDPDPDLDADALRAVAGDDDDDDEADDADPVDENPSDERDAKALAAADGPGPAPVEGKGAKDDGAEDAPQPQRVYDARLPSDYDDQLQGIKDEDARLRQAFKDGDIDIDERDAGLAALTEKREALLVARTKAEIAGEMSQQTAQQQWTSTIKTFMADTAKNDGIDYRKDPELGKALDGAVKMFANDPANEDKSMEWFLTQAHKWVMFNRGITPAKRPADPKKAAADKRKPDLSGLPQTLADVPGADGPGDVASEFANLDSLDGEALETAIARMSPTQRERYLRGE